MDDTRRAEVENRFRELISARVAGDAGLYSSLRRGAVVDVFRRAEGTPEERLRQVAGELAVWVDVLTGMAVGAMAAVGATTGEDPQVIWQRCLSQAGCVGGVGGAMRDDHPHLRLANRCSRTGDDGEAAKLRRLLGGDDSRPGCLATPSCACVACDEEGG